MNCEKVMVTIPADTVARAAEDNESIQVLVWLWENAPVEVDVRRSEDHAEPWTPLSMMGGRCGRVA